MRIVGKFLFLWFFSTLVGADSTIEALADDLAEGKLSELGFYQSSNIHYQAKLGSSFELLTICENAAESYVPAEYLTYFQAEQRAWRSYFDRACLYFGAQGDEHPRSQGFKLVCQLGLVEQRLRAISPWLGEDDLYGQMDLASEVISCD